MSREITRLSTVLDRFGAKDRASSSQLLLGRSRLAETHVYKQIVEWLKEKAKENGQLDDVNKWVKQLEHQARELVSVHHSVEGSNVSYVYNACLTLLLIFRSSTEGLSSLQQSQLLESFGPYGEGPVKRISKTVSLISSLVGGSALRQRLRQPDIPDLLNKKMSRSARRKKIKDAQKHHKMMLDQEMKNEFGAKITVNLPKKEEMEYYECDTLACLRRRIKSWVLCAAPLGKMTNSTTQ